MSEMSRLSSSPDATPAPLADAVETDLFGLSTSSNSLRPTTDNLSGLPSDGNGSKRSLGIALPDAPLSRAAKRPKSVKFRCADRSPRFHPGSTDAHPYSPAKGEGGRARRVVSTAASAQARATALALGLPVEAESVVSPPLYSPSALPSLHIIYHSTDDR